jgi:peptidoglycan/LPS O-acetylase OafA/YrhL
VWHGTADGHGEQWRVEWVASIVAAAAVFAVGLAVRNRRIPRLLAWLGLISYSVYLLHPLVFPGFHTFPALARNFSMPVQVLLWAGLVALVIAASAITYYAVEQPMQRLGRRVARGLHNRQAARGREAAATLRSG